MTKISILIANYNNGKYFSECYQSLIGQTYKKWEAIIIDDCSTDNSIEIIKELIKDDDRFILIHNVENKGCGYTKRRCMDYANGEVCAYLDPDDALYPTALEESMKYYETFDSIVCTYSKMMMCDENLKPIELFSQTKPILNDTFFFNCPIQFAHFFTFRTDTYNKTEGINPALTTAIDQDLYLKILEHGSAKFIRKVLYKYRLHENGISQSRGKENAKKSLALVIFNTMKRRGIRYINNQKVPKELTDPEEIFSLLRYQTRIFYRLKLKLMVFFLNL